MCVSVCAVVEVTFGDLLFSVEEGVGVLEVPLVKSQGAVGRVGVRLFTLDITASGTSL